MWDSGGEIEEEYGNMCRVLAKLPNLRTLSFSIDDEVDSTIEFLRSIPLLTNIRCVIWTPLSTNLCIYSTHLNFFMCASCRSVDSSPGVGVTDDLKQAIY